MADALAQAMLRHLPPSGATLRLLDVGGQCGAVFSARRKDLNITTMDGAVAGWQLAPDSFDAVVFQTPALADEFLAAVLAALRPGGRLIIGLLEGRSERRWVDLLDAAGYTRILVESAPGGVLVRGEKPHTEQHTVDRIRQVADRDTASDLSAFKGRYLHLLIVQTPNKPVWALHPDERVAWQAVVASIEDTPHLLAFSSLPKAVAFMQPAVMQGLVGGVNKVGKFSRETAQSWPLPVLLNPELDSVAGHEISFWSLDPNTAETPDE